MPASVFRNALFWVNGVDYSTDISELTLNYASEMLDVTNMGQDTRVKKGGLKVWSIAVKTHEDFTATKLGANLFALVGTTTCVELRPFNTCTTVINPSFSGIATPVNAPPMAGAVGSVLDMAFTMESGGTLNRSTTAT